MRFLQTVSLLSLAAVVIACAGSPPGPSNGDAPGAGPAEAVTAAAAGSAAPADSAPAAPGTVAPAESGGAAAVPSGHVVGGYSAQDTNEPGVQAAAAKAIGLLQTKTRDPSLALGKVVSAQTQVVAGLNYRLELELTSESGPKKATVVVFRDLKNGYVIMSVEGL